MSRQVWWDPPRPLAKRWRYVVTEAGNAPERGGWFFTNRAEAAHACQGLSLSAGEPYTLIDRRTRGWP